MLISWFKTEGIIEGIYHALYVGLGNPHKNLAIKLRLLDALKIVTKKILWVIFLLKGEAHSLNQVKYMDMVLVHNNQVIIITCHI